MTLQNGLLIFLWKETFRNKIMEIVEDFACESKFIQFSFFFIIFLHFFVFVSFFHFSSFFHFLSFSFFFLFHFLFLSFLIFSFVLSFFLFFFFFLSGARNLIFFWASISLRSLLAFLLKNSIVRPVRPLFLFFSSFFFSSFFFFLFFFFLCFNVFL